jgi:protein PhnA
MLETVEIPHCPQCQGVYVYQDQLLFICPECTFEWQQTELGLTESSEIFKVIDAFGTELRDGDSVTLIKDLKVKGASSPIKAGTKVKNIRLVDGDHNIDCKIPGLGAIALKSEFVKKLT